jgi:hypothetical protein
MNDRLLNIEPAIAVRRWKWSNRMTSKNERRPTFYRICIESIIDLQSVWVKTVTLGRRTLCASA